MDKNGTLDCNKYMDLCCGTCTALGSASFARAPTTTEEPLAFKTLPPGFTSTPSHHVCSDRDGVQQCEQLVKYNKLNCFTVEGTARCCGTCNALMDYIETIATYIYST
ncbi:unnamed protein product [Cylicostephanus goldi]|uniref:Uncharacterized protein n=1 Tax=Cylicostephanus goldi TaxID=71465 RepID=A0A3P6RWF1_CYLGO|nr:unnamed protein product [Cylicostephanus goldi]